LWRPGECNKDIVHNVLGGAVVAEEPERDGQHRPLVLCVDAAKGIRTAPFEPQLVRIDTGVPQLLNAEDRLSHDRHDEGADSRGIHLGDEVSVAGKEELGTDTVLAVASVRLDDLEDDGLLCHVHARGHDLPVPRIFLELIQLFVRVAEALLHHQPDVVRYGVFRHGFLL